jgi:cytochrome b
MKTVMTMIKPINLLFAWHGLLAGSYFVAYATAEMSLRMHEAAGWFVIGLIGLRLLAALFAGQSSPWSLPWPNSALVKAFFNNLAKLDPMAFRGRNPLLILSGLAMLTLALLAALSGLLPWEDPHEGLAEFSLFFLAVHGGLVLIAQGLKALAAISPIKPLRQPAAPPS